MEKEFIRKELVKIFKEKFPKGSDLVDIPKLVKKAKVKDSPVRLAIVGDSLPSIPNVQKLLKACDWTMSRFFAYLESLEQGEEQNPQISDEHGRAVEMLSVIFQQGDDRTIGGIVVNLERFCEAIGSRGSATQLSGGGVEVKRMSAPAASRVKQKQKKIRKRSAVSHSPPDGRTIALG